MMEEQDVDGDKECVIIYDGSCELCNKTVRFINKRDKKKRFNFRAFDTEKGRDILKHQGLNTSDFNSVVYIKDKKYFYKSSAALQILKDTGGFYKLLYVFIIIPKPVRDFVYDFIAKRRHTK